VVDDFKDGPFLGTEEFPGPRGKNEGVPSGDGQRAHEKILVSRQVRGKLEGVRKKACADFMVSSRERDMFFMGDVLMMSAMAAREEREGLSRGRQVANRLLFDERM